MDASMKEEGNGAPSYGANVTVDEIPGNLRKLALILTKTFHGDTHYLLMRLLEKHVCVSEDRLSKLLHLDKKKLKEVIMHLRADKFIRERTIYEMKANGTRGVKCMYYFINYCGILNVAMYKIYVIQKRLDKTDHPSGIDAEEYVCGSCGLAYTVADMPHIFDAKTGRMVCWHCGGNVEIHEKYHQSVAARNSVSHFNEQMKRILELIISLDGIQLAPHLREPTIIPESLNLSGTSEKDGESSTSQSSASKSPTFSFAAPVNEETSYSVELLNAVKSVEKELPSWLNYEPMVITEGTKEAMYPSPAAADDQLDTIAAAVENLENKEEGVKEKLDAEVLRRLNDEYHKDILEEEEEEWMGNWTIADEDSESPTASQGTLLTVDVQGVAVPYDSVTSEQLMLMSAHEKEKYKLVGQQVYSQYL